MKIEIAGIVAVASVCAASFSQGAELPDYSAMSSCKLFGEVASPSCLSREREEYRISGDLWLKADEDARRGCKASVEQWKAPDIRPYEILAQCLALRAGQMRLLVGSSISWKQMPQR